MLELYTYVEETHLILSYSELKYLYMIFFTPKLTPSHFTPLFNWFVRYDIWDTPTSTRLRLERFVDLWDKDDTWQTDKKELKNEERLISVSGDAAIREHKVHKTTY